MTHPQPSSYTAAELEHAQRHRPPDRPDAYCVDCPFSDRGDFLVYRSEWDALNADRIENRRLRKALEEVRDYDIVDDGDVYLDAKRMTEIAGEALNG